MNNSVKMERIAMKMRLKTILISILGAIIIVFCGASSARAESRVISALDTFASRSETHMSTSMIRVVSPPPTGKIRASDVEMYLGEAHGTGFWHRRSRIEVTTSRTVGPIIIAGETQGGRWRIPLKSNHLRAILPGYSERNMVETHFTETTNIPNVYNYGSFPSTNVYSYSLSSQWDMLKNRTMEISFIENKVRQNSACKGCRPTIRSDIWRVELYPNKHDRVNWNLRLERHDRERFSNIGYHVRMQGDYEVYKGFHIGLVVGRFYNGMNPAGEEFSELAGQLVFQYLDGGSSTFNKFYTKQFAFYKLTAGYQLEF